MNKLKKTKVDRKQDDKVCRYSGTMTVTECENIEKANKKMFDFFELHGHFPFDKFDVDCEICKNKDLK